MLLYFTLLFVFTYNVSSHILVAAIAYSVEGSNANVDVKSEFWWRLGFDEVTCITLAFTIIFHYNLKHNPNFSPFQLSNRFNPLTFHTLQH